MYVFCSTFANGTVKLMSEHREWHLGSTVHSTKGDLSNTMCVSFLMPHDAHPCLVYVCEVKLDCIVWLYWVLYAPNLRSRLWLQSWDCIISSNSTFSYTLLHKHDIMVFGRQQMLIINGVLIPMHTWWQHLLTFYYDKNSDKFVWKFLICPHFLALFFSVCCGLLGPPFCIVSLRLYVLCLLVVLVKLPVQVIDCEVSSPKWPITCWCGR